jgi:hypothetical protein
MNQWNTSPIGQTNEVARQGTPKNDENGDAENTKQTKGFDYKYLLAEDLQKIRKSNHSSHHGRREVMDDDEHDGIIKGLLYPGLESSENEDFDFFEEDYEMAQAVVDSSTNPHVPSVAAYPNTSYNDAAFNDAPRLQDDYSSYHASYFAAMGKPYSDLTSQKLRR